MVKLTAKHRMSLDRAILIMRLRARNQPIRRFRKEWERDLRLLNQLLKFVDHQIKNPKLPMFDNLSEASVEHDGI